MKRLICLLAASSVVVAVTLAVGGCKDEPKRPSGATRPASAGKLNVLLITLDTTRADRLGCYGYAKAQTPALDSLAAGGLRFSNALTHVPMTLPAHASMLTGMLPPEHGLRDNGRGRLGPEPVCLAQILRKRGYRTAAFLASFVLDKQFGLNRGFEVYDDRMAPASETESVFAYMNPADVVADRALAWLGEHAGEPFFCWAHFFDPHDPYEPPEPFRSRMKDPYDGEIAFMDSQIKRLLAFLDARGLRERTLVIACGDHGEAFGEHAEHGHGPLVYRTTMHVPLLISLPGRIRRGATDDRVVGVSDVASTVLGVLGEKRPPGMTGRDLLASSSEPRACYGESESLLNRFGWAPLRSLTTRRWLYIQCPVPELYDRLADPGETRDLALAKPQAAGEMRSHLERVRAGMKLRKPVKAALDAEALEALRSLGYLGGPASRPAAVDPGQRKDPKAMMGVYNAWQAASRLVDSNRYQEAIKLFLPAVEANPESMELRRFVIACYMHLKQYDQAIEHMKVHLAADPDNWELLANLGAALLGQGKPAEAATVLRHCLRTASTTQGVFRGPHGITITRSRVSLGRAYHSLGKLPQAVQQFELILRDEPEHFAAHYNLATIYAATGRSDEAIRHCRAVLDKAPDTATGHADFGGLLRRLGQLKQAAAQYRRSVELAPDVPGVHIELAHVLLADGQAEAALGQYREAVRLDPGSAGPLASLGRALAQLKRNPQALQAFQKALAIRETGTVHSDIAVLHERAGRIDLAIASFEKALKLAPDNGTIRRNFGLVLCRQKKFGRAIQVWDEGLKYSPDDPQLSYYLAWWLATCPQARHRNGAKAVALAGKVCRATGRRQPEPLDALAAAYAESGQFAEAAATAREALALARAQKSAALAEAIEKRIALYAASKPYQQPP